MTLVIVLILMVICIVTESARIIRHIDLVAAELHLRIHALEKQDAEEK